MFHLHRRLGTFVDAWRGDGYPYEDHPAIGEILEWAQYQIVFTGSSTVGADQVREVLSLIEEPGP